jgi:hydrogenase nickel incorporation protein HypA/HybF
MHEFSIAEALAGQVRRHVPTGRVVSVELRVGALRGIEPDALRMCWDAVTHGTPLAGAALEVEALPWSITCDSCGRSWASRVPFVDCSCGNRDTTPAAGDELDLVAITVEDEGAAA